MSTATRLIILASLPVSIFYLALSAVPFVAGGGSTILVLLDGVAFSFLGATALMASIRGIK